MSTAILKFTARFAGVVLGATTGLLLALLVQTQGAGRVQGQTLTIGLENPVQSIDPHFYNEPTNNAFSRHIFEALVTLDAKLAVQPRLAVSWSRSEDTTWEFRLREGIQFHDGSEFTADDVLYSFSRAANVPNSPSGFSRYTRRIVAVDKVDAYTLRIKTDRPHPLLLNDISNLRIISLKAAEGKTNSEINAGQGAVGTGPYRVAVEKMMQWAPGKTVELERHGSYWGARSAWEQVIFRQIPGAKARITALQKGAVQLIDGVTAESLNTLRRNKRIVVRRNISNRLVFLQVDSGRNESPFVTGTRGKNPLRRPQVRKAISLAINRKMIIEDILKGDAVPTGQLMPEGVTGAVQGMAPDKYDPKEARRQLARGGYPSGFGLTLHGPRQFLPHDVEVLKAVAVGLKRIGIVAQAESMPSRIFFPLAAKRKFSMLLYSWRLEAGDAAEPLMALLATSGGRNNWGGQNFGGFSNADLDAALTTAMGAMDDSRRGRLLREATRIGMRELGIIPLYFEVNHWAMRKGLRLRTRIDGATLAMNVTSIK